MLFFARNTRSLNLTKLCKLLYFLDFTHFRQTGYPSIGLQYYTFKKGPVPKDFWLEIKDGNVPEDFKGRLALTLKIDELAPSYKEMDIQAIKAPDMSIFTPREIEILGNLAFIYKDAKAWEISEVTHLLNEPWDTTIKKSGENAPINYLLGIDKESEIDLDEAEELIKDHFETLYNFGIKPTK